MKDDVVYVDHNFSVCVTFINKYKTMYRKNSETIASFVECLVLKKNSLYSASQSYFVYKLQLYYKKKLCNTKQVTMIFLVLAVC